MRPSRRATLPVPMRVQAGREVVVAIVVVSAAAAFGGAGCASRGAGAAGTDRVAASGVEAAPHGAATGGNEGERGVVPAPAGAEAGAGEGMMELPVPGHHVAIVSVPVGARAPRPVIVAAHGAGDRPEWQCGLWREIVRGRAFVLCPRGFAMNPHVPPEQTGYFYTTHHMLGDEVTAALRAFSERFGRYADTSAPVYAGFSQGAIMGALLLPQHPARFGRAVLIEGGYGLFQEWNRLVAKRFKERGGERILMACGRAACAAEAEVSAGYMRSEGLLAKVVHAPGAGHTYGGGVADEVARAFVWVVEGDGRFGGAI